MEIEASPRCPHRYFMGLAYFGPAFTGWEKQAGQATVQGLLEEAARGGLGIGSRAPLESAAAGRTDAGVHATQQVVQLDLPLALPPLALEKALAPRLGPHARLLWVRAAPRDFHVRFHCQGRMYRYLIQTGASGHPFFHELAWQYPGSLDLDAMRAAAALLEGKHDFSAFRSAHCQAARTQRTLETLRVQGIDGGALRIDVAAPSFLHQMVRILVGTLVDVGKGRRDPRDMTEILASGERRKAGPTAPPQGLYFVGARYGEALGLPGPSWPILPPSILGPALPNPSGAITL